MPYVLYLGIFLHLAMAYANKIFDSSIGVPIYTEYKDDCKLYWAYEKPLCMLSNKYG